MNGKLSKVGHILSVVKSTMRTAKECKYTGEEFRAYVIRRLGTIEGLAECLRHDITEELRG